MPTRNFLVLPIIVIAHRNGRPYEERQIAEKLRELIQKKDFPPVVFHSLRHTSTSAKLQISGGNIKAVQGDTGHAHSKMVTDRYAHVFTEDRHCLAQDVEQKLFQRPVQVVSDKEPPQDETAQALRLIQENPAMAKLIIAALGQTENC